MASNSSAQCNHSASPSTETCKTIEGNHILINWNTSLFVRLLTSRIRSAIWLSKIIMFIQKRLMSTFKTEYEIISMFFCCRFGFAPLLSKHIFCLYSFVFFSLPLPFFFSLQHLLCSSIIYDKIMGLSSWEPHCLQSIKQHAHINFVFRA